MGPTTIETLIYQRSIVDNFNVSITKGGAAVERTSAIVGAAVVASA